jgi:hypothetical protein
MVSDPFSSRTEKLPKGRSYPVKPSDLAEAVRRAGITIPIELVRWDLFEYALVGKFNPPGWIPSQNGESIWLRCRSVPAERAAEARTVVAGQAIPQFIEWARGIEALDVRSPIRRESQTFSFSLDEFAR